MNVMKTPDGVFTPALLFAAVLMLISVGLITRLKDPEYKTA
jgi:hypothetical protein